VSLSAPEDPRRRRPRPPESRSIARNVRTPATLLTCRRQNAGRHSWVAIPFSRNDTANTGTRLELVRQGRGFESLVYRSATRATTATGSTYTVVRCGRVRFDPFTVNVSTVMEALPTCRHSALRRPQRAPVSNIARARRPPAGGARPVDQRSHDRSKRRAKRREAYSTRGGTSGYMSGGRAHPAPVRERDREHALANAGHAADLAEPQRASAPT